MLLLPVCAAAHLLTDALCAATLFGQTQNRTDFWLLLILYNTLAFSTQAAAGLVSDRCPGRQPYFAPAAMASVILGFLLPSCVYLKTVLIGLGNSVFHVSCGQMVLLRSGKKASHLGVFVAPGAIGLTLGTLFPAYGGWFAGGLAVFCVLVFSAARSAGPFEIGPEEEPEKPLLPVILLSLAVAVRAVGGGAVFFPWKQGAAAALLLTLFVFAGKFAGGFLCDTLGPKRSAVFSVVPAAVLILFGSAFAVPSLIGQFALNLTMPVTLWLLYLEMPRSPGFAFGLAASVLWPGTLAGGLLRLDGAPQKICVGISFLFALCAVLFAASSLNLSRKEKTR